MPRLNTTLRLEMKRRSSILSVDISRGGDAALRDYEEKSALAARRRDLLSMITDLQRRLALLGRNSRLVKNCVETMRQEYARSSQPRRKRT